MSWKNYPVLDVIPSFDPIPSQGLGEISRGSVQIGQDASFFSWDGDTGLAFKHRFLTRSRAEWGILRDLIGSFRGKGVGFFLPTWQPDFILAADASAAATTISVEEAGFSSISDDFPDTEGRIIFFLKTDLSLQINRVASAVDDGGNETLTLEDPLEFDLDAAVDMVGICYLVRLAEDQINYKNFAPGRGFVDLRFLTSRATRKVGTVELVESEAP